MLGPASLLASIASVFPFVLVPVLVLCLLGFAVVVRHQRVTDSGHAVPYVLLGIAVVVVSLSSVIATSPVADDASGQCGADAMAAADKPEAATANILGLSCHQLGTNEIHNAYLLVITGAVLAVVAMLYRRNADREA